MSNHNPAKVVTIHLDDEQSAMLDQARGTIDAESFVREGAMQYARILLRVQQELPPSRSAFSDHEPTPEELVRLADEAELNSVSLEQAIEEVQEHLAMLRVAS